MFRRLRVALVPAMSASFRGDKEGRYATCVSHLEELAQRWGFDFHAVRQGVYTRDDCRSAREELERWGPDLILLQAASFADGKIVQELWPVSPFLGLWAVPEEADKSGPLLFNALCAMNMYSSMVRRYLLDRRPVKWFYGMPGQPLFDRRFEITVRALTVVVNLRGARVGLIGGIAPGFDNLYFDERKLRARLGVEVVRRELDELLALARSYGSEDVALERAELLRSVAGIEAGMEDCVEVVARLVKACRDLARRDSCCALALSCWPRLQVEMGCAACTAVGALNEGGLPTACEGDVYGAVSMLVLTMLTSRPVSLMDLVDLDESDQSVLLWHCGPAPPSLANPEGVYLRSNYLLDDGVHRYGLINCLVMRPGPATALVYTGDFERMLVMTGRLDDRKPGNWGSRGWLHDLHVAGEPASVRDLLETVMTQGVQHHYAVAHGDVGDLCLEIAAWQGVRPLGLLRYRDYLQNPGFSDGTAFPE